MSSAVWGRFAGSVLGYFRLGMTGGVRLKNNSGVLAVRDDDDSVDASMTAASLTLSGRGFSNPVALSVASNLVAVDLSLNNNFTLTLQATTGQTLSNPTNAVAGQKGTIYITQNGTPSTLAYGSQWIEDTTGTAPAVSTTASAQNELHYSVFDSTHIYYVLNKHGVT